MARISLDSRPSLFSRLTGWYTRRLYGSDLQPAQAALHNRRVALSYAVHEGLVARWNGLDPQLKALAVLAAAQRIGCPWCVDFGFWQFSAQGMSAEKLEAVSTWRTSGLFDETERAVLAYAEAMTADVSTDVSDEMVADLVDRLGEAALVELTMMVAVENQRSRFNSALGLTPQGFKDRCEPTARTAARSGA